MSRIILQGIPVSPGIAIGPLLLLPDAYLYEKRTISGAEIEAEIDALNMASRQVCQNLEKAMLNVPDELAEYREIVGAQRELAKDPRILESARARIRHRKICAAWALSETVDELSALFQGMPDPHLSEGARDIKAIGKCLGDCLGGIKNCRKVSERGILAGRELSPAELVDLTFDGLEGILTVEGGPTSHTAILARGLKVPALVGIADLFNHAREGETVIVDALSGIVLIAPDEADISRYLARKRNYDQFEVEAWQEASDAAITRDGVKVTVFANLENKGELENLAESGAEGIGLYRTEFSYLGGGLPSEEELVSEYAAVIAGIAPKKVIFRTLDAGADKILPIQEALHEPNPALGLRGIRFSLKRKDIFRTQLRALLRACHGANAAIILPMVSMLREVRETKAIIGNIMAELRAENLPCAESLPLGIMVETPAAVLNCDSLAAECDFLSIGTNDLLHYLMAIDRNNRHVAYLHEPLHPAFIRSIKLVMDAGHKNGIEVSMCGELASDPFGIVLLTGMGIDALSASPVFVPGIKHMLRKLDAGICSRLVNEILNETEASRIRDMLLAVLNANIGSELSFHNSISVNGGWQ